MTAPNHVVELVDSRSERCLSARPPAGLMAGRVTPGRCTRRYDRPPVGGSAQSLRSRGGRRGWMATTKEMAMTDSAGTASLEANLRLGNGLKEHDRARVLRRLGGLDARLRSFRADAVDLL
jgi:hypothetical protein